MMWRQIYFYYKIFFFFQYVENFAEFDYKSELLLLR